MEKLTFCYSEITTNYLRHSGKPSYPSSIPNKPTRRRHSGDRSPVLQVRCAYRLTCTGQQGEENHEFETSN